MRIDIYASKLGRVSAAEVYLPISEALRVVYVNEIEIQNLYIGATSTVCRFEVGEVAPPRFRWLANFERRDPRVAIQGVWFWKRCP